jgi:gamma-glutamylcyclotransferase (GGCT)/AIG2-like uncharacterized protein YtfP
MKIFVYGTLKRGFGLHRYLAECPFLGRAQTVEPHVLLDSGFPVMTPLGCGAVTVEGEVYEVESPALVDRLDRIEGAYDRELIEVRYEDDAVQEVWAYIGKPEAWKHNSSLGIQWLDGSVFCYDGSDLETEECDEPDGSPDDPGPWRGDR